MSAWQKSPEAADADVTGNPTSPDKSDTISVQTNSKISVTGDTEDLITEEEPPKGCWHSFTKGVGGSFVSCIFGQFS